MHTLKLTQVGNSVGVILPKDALARLHLDKGDTLYMTETPTGYRLTVTDPAFETQMIEARKIMKRYRNTLAELAK
jgi:putative addiction module antidote